MAKNKLPAADVTEDPHYHDTWTLLRKYRDVVWSLEVSVRQVRNRFRIDYGKTIEDLSGIWSPMKAETQGLMPPAPSAMMNRPVIRM